MKKRGLFWQLFLSHLLISLLALLAVNFHAKVAFNQFYERDTYDDLIGRALTAAQTIEPLVAENRYDEMERVFNLLGERSHTSYAAIVLDNGAPARRVYSQNASEFPFDSNVTEAMRGLVVRDTYLDRNTGVRSLAIFMAIPADNPRVALRAQSSMNEMEMSFKRFHRRNITMGIAVASLSMLIGFYAVSRFSRPIEEIKRGARRFAKGELNHRISVHNAGELSGVAVALNSMASELDDKIQKLANQQMIEFAVLDSMIEGVIAVDTAQRVILFNRAAQEMMPSDSYLALDRRIVEVIRNAEFQETIQRVLSTGEPQECETTFRDVDSEGTDIKVSGTVLRNHSGETMGALTVIRDETRIRKLETMRRDFVANVSHELMTPITTIKGFVETLLDGMLDNREQSERFLGKVAANTDRLSRIIEDLLSLSRIEQNSEEAAIEMSVSNLRQILDAAVGASRRLAREFGTEITIDCREDLEATVNPRLLEQALVNLIQNAIKYSDTDRPIEIEAENREGLLTIRVRDHGVGIPREHLPRLFERFYRVDAARSRKFGGTGLGLAIVKHIAIAHQGEVRVSSDVGTGSCFMLILPVEARAGKQPV